MNGAPRLGLHADDYSMSPGVNRAIRNLIERGRLNHIGDGSRSRDRSRGDFGAAERGGFRPLLRDGAASGDGASRPYPCTFPSD